MRHVAMQSSSRGIFKMFSQACWQQEADTRRAELTEDLDSAAAEDQFICLTLGPSAPVILRQAVP